MLKFFLGWCVERYLDDFIAVWSASEGTSERLCVEETKYRTLTDLLGIP